MFKKHLESILALVLATGLTTLLYTYLSHIEVTEAAKSNIQTAIENASHRWNDLFYRDKSLQTPSQDVVLLAIDEPSIIEIGRWPWSRNIINRITEQLLKYKVKTVAYDIIFSESESSKTDENFAKTISTASNQLIFGTFSDLKSYALPYQDYCLTQAFLYTGGGSLAKVNPYFSVEDDENRYEEQSKAAQKKWNLVKPSKKTSSGPSISASRR